VAFAVAVGGWVALELAFGVGVGGETVAIAGGLGVETTPGTLGKAPDGVSTVEASGDGELPGLTAATRVGPSGVSADPPADCVGTVVANGA
jgi:hypothetical protein